MEYSRGPAGQLQLLLSTMKSNRLSPAPRSHDAARSLSDLDYVPLPSKTASLSSIVYERSEEKTVFLNGGHSGFNPVDSSCTEKFHIFHDSTYAPQLDWELENEITMCPRAWPRREDQPGLTDVNG